ncbi:MAG TPA: crosslink repair DNA glycosylase YcaQ family protein [Solirubrobacteraceae bacterium]|nr:crosslink repair DNA glycosylase YcaQ family protein [Solirubrobacteraceae bacterium]
MIEQLRAFSYERQRLGRAAPNAARALQDVIAVYSSHPTAPLSLHARAEKMDAKAFHRLKAVRLPAMRMSIHLLPAKTAHLAFHATPAPAADRKKRMKHFKFTPQRYEALRKQILKAATEPLTLPELREAVGAEPEELKGVSAQMTRDAELVRVGADSLRSNELRYVAVELEDADAEEALAWLAGEYLRAFGPIRVKDFVWWAGVTAGRAKQALAAHDTDEIDGHLILATDVKAFEKAKPAKGVDLLPKWDAYTMGYAPDGRDRFAHPDVVKECYDFRGDGRPVILVDGQAAGTWEKLEPQLFDKAGAGTRKAIDERLDAVKAFLG